MAAGKNVCECPLPPGGQAVCDENHLAICRVINGKAHTECVDLSQYGDNLSAIKSAMVKAITKESYTLEMPLTYQEISILDSGFYQSEKAGIVTFSQPSYIRVLEENVLLRSVARNNRKYT